MAACRQSFDVPGPPPSTVGRESIENRFSIDFSTVSPPQVVSAESDWAQLHARGKKQPGCCSDGCCSAMAAGYLVMLLGVGLMIGWAADRPGREPPLSTAAANTSAAATPTTEPAVELLDPVLRQVSTPHEHSPIVNHAIRHRNCVRPDQRDTFSQVLQVATFCVNMVIGARIATLASITAILVAVSVGYGRKFSQCAKLQAGDVAAVDVQSFAAAFLAVLHLLSLATTLDATTPFHAIMTDFAMLCGWFAAALLSTLSLQRRLCQSEPVEGVRSQQLQLVLHLLPPLLCARTSAAPPQTCSCPAGATVRCYLLSHILSCGRKTLVQAGLQHIQCFVLMAPLVECSLLAGTVLLQSDKPGFAARWSRLACFCLAWIFCLVAVVRLCNHKLPSESDLDGDSVDVERSSPEPLQAQQTQRGSGSLQRN
eukprot:SAG31_NODE_7380_length_1704_cov_1.867913_2_plen_425_part_01